MPTPGYYFRDGGATPPGERTDPMGNDHADFRRRIAQPKKPVTATSKAPLGQETSTSHVLATQNHAIQGAAQEAGKDDNITNLGWQKNAKGVDTLVGGLDNDELWMLIRRFNKVCKTSRLCAIRLTRTQQTFHVKAIPQAPPGGLDLNIADEDEFSPIKLRANLERLYMTVIIGLMGFGKHIVRLRSWREPHRTIPFAVVYFLAWLLNLVVPTMLITFIVLIIVPEAREILFPPAPLALVDSKTGGVQTPKAGVLGSHDSATGAPEKHKGEAVEQEASNLVSSIGSVALSSAAGRHDQGEPDGGSGSKKLDKHAPDPTNGAMALADASSAASGGQPGHGHDKTKAPMEDAIWTKMRPVMHVVGDVADGWERFANALSPVPPFDDNKRLQLAAIFAPMLLLSLFVKAAWVVRGTYFISGLIFFTDPLQQRGIALLNEKIPDWPKYLEIRNTLLKGVPTNAQLTVTLLRIGEANRAPLPPPPTSSEPPSEKPADIDKHALTNSGLDATHSDIEDAITVDRPSSAEGDMNADGTAAAPGGQKKKGIGAKIVGAFKHTTAAGIETKLTADNARAAIGSQHAKEKLGILPTKAEQQRKPVEGPVEFKGRCDGRKGAVYVDSSVSPASSAGHPESPCVYFSTDLDGDEVVESIKPKSIKWSVSIRDIQEIKKVGGLGWKARIIVGWATDREIKDSITIIDKAGREYKATALAQRDELFNRLVAMGQQVWEAY